MYILYSFNTYLLSDMLRTLKHCRYRYGQENLYLKECIMISTPLDSPVCVDFLKILVNGLQSFLEDLTIWTFLKIYK